MTKAYYVMGFILATWRRQIPCQDSNPLKSLSYCMYVMDFSRLRGSDICRTIHFRPIDERSKPQDHSFRESEGYGWESKPPREKAGWGLHIVMEHLRWAIPGCDYPKSTLFLKRGPRITSCICLFLFESWKNRELHGRFIPYLKTLIRGRACSDRLVHGTFPSGIQCATFVAASRTGRDHK
jgi:hypothetical protein